MTTKILVPCLLLVCSTANAQLSSTTFGGIPLWADSALRTGGLNQRFTLASTFNPFYAFGDFDRDGLIDIAVEVKGMGGCGIAIAHRIDRSVHIVGIGTAVGNGKSEVTCGRWGVAPAERDHAFVFVNDPVAPSGWLVWDGHSYVWIQAE